MCVRIIVCPNVNEKEEESIESDVQRYSASTAYNNRSISSCDYKCCITWMLSKWKAQIDRINGLSRQFISFGNEKEQRTVYELLWLQSRWIILHFRFESNLESNGTRYLYVSLKLSHLKHYLFSQLQSFHFCFVQ